MNIKYFFIIVLTTYQLNLFSQQRDYPLVSIPQTKMSGIPENWLLGGSNPHDYSIGVDVNHSVSGFSSAFLKSASVKPVGFVTLMQSFKSNNYRGQRIKLSAYIKTKFVSGWSGLWMRVNDSAGKPLSFDDMRERPLLGSMEWKQFEIVLDVPTMSDEISFGLLLQGKGQVWIDNIQFSKVGEDIPVTDLFKNKVEVYSPKNLDFEE